MNIELIGKLVLGTNKKTLIHDPYGAGTIGNHLVALFHAKDGPAIVVPHSSNIAAWKWTKGLTEKIRNESLDTIEKYTGWLEDGTGLPSGLSSMSPFIVNMMVREVQGIRCMHRDGSNPYYIPSIFADGEQHKLNRAEIKDAANHYDTLPDMLAGAILAGKKVDWQYNPIFLKYA